MTPFVHLLGAGVVNRAITIDHLNRGIPVRLYDVSADALTACRSVLQTVCSPIRSAGTSSPFQFFDAWTESGSSDSGSGYRLVIESVPEEVNLKKQAFEEIARLQPSETVYATNTSTLSVKQIADGLSVQRRFGGLHFFMPVVNRPAVELIVPHDVDEDVVPILQEHASRLGKAVVNVADRPGFLVNRTLSPYLNEALDLLCQGVSADRIEAAAAQYGMPLSPLELIDTIGFKTMWLAGRAYWQAFPDRVKPNPIVPRMLKSKRFGRDCGKGIYDYEGDFRSPKISEDVVELVKRYAVDSRPMTDEQVQARLAVPMFVEAELAIQENVVGSHEDVNTAMEGGLGYRAETSWTDWFESRGAAWVLDASQEFQEVSPAMKLPAWLRERLSR